VFGKYFIELPVGVITTIAIALYNIKQSSRVSRGKPIERKKYNDSEFRLKSKTNRFSSTSCGTYSGLIRVVTTYESKNRLFRVSAANLLQFIFCVLRASISKRSDTIYMLSLDPDNVSLSSVRRAIKTFSIDLSFRNVVDQRFSTGVP